MIGQDVTDPGLADLDHLAHRPVDLGQRLFRGRHQPPAPGATQEYTRAGSFTPDENGNLKNAAGLYLLGCKLDSQGNVPTNSSALSLINVASLSGKAQATTTLGIQANLQASATVAGGYTAGDMTAGTVTPDFQRTINVYDSQGGSQPVTFSFVKTAANTWAYEVAYAGAAGQPVQPQPDRHRHRDVQLRRHAEDRQRRGAGIGYFQPDHSLGGDHRPRRAGHRSQSGHASAAHPA